MKLVKLGSVCEVIMGQSPAGSLYNEKGEGYPLISGAGDLGEKYPSPKKHTYQGSKISKNGDIILCIRATIGRKNYSDKEYCLGRGVAGLRANDNDLNQSFLWWWLEKGQLELCRLAKGSTFKQVDKQSIELLEIPLPPIAAQKRIAAILDKADAVRCKRREAIRLTEELLRSTFLEMFGDPVTNSKKWKVVDFDQIRNGDIRNGLSPSSTGRFQSQVLTLAAITQNKFNISEKKSGFFDKEPTPEKTLNPKVFLICRGNGNLNLVGRGKFPDILTENIFFPDTMIGVPVDQVQINPDFLEFLWDTRFIRDQVESQARTTNGTYKINQDVVRKLKIFLPLIQSQEKFGKIVKITKKTAAFSLLEESENLFNSLLQRAFTGNL